MFQKNKGDLFEMWLEGDRNWRQVEMHVERKVSQESLSRKQWVAVQGKTLRTSYEKSKFEALVKRRREEGLYYEDDDFPDDPDEAWYYMPHGNKIRKDDKTKESVSLRGKAKMDSEMLKSITAEGSALAAGAVPNVHAATEKGKQKLLQAVASAPVAAKKKVKAPTKEPASEVVQPSTPIELALMRMPEVLSESCKSREKAIALGAVEYTGELATSLKSHGSFMEGVYQQMQKATASGVQDAGFYSKIFKLLDEKQGWFVKAEARAWLSVFTVLHSGLFVFNEWPNTKSLSSLMLGSLVFQNHVIKKA